MAKNEGKQFEKDWEQSCPPDIYIERFKDSAMWGKGAQNVASKNPCDFIMYSFPTMYLLEMKSTAGTSFSFDEKIIKKHQIDSLTKADQIYGIIAGFLFNFRDRETKKTKRDNVTYFVDIWSFVKFKAESGKSSINEEECAKIGYKVPSKKKIIHHTYDIEAFDKHWGYKCG